LATTDLVHEAYFSLVGIEGVGWANRAHFLAIAARAMRQLLVDHARRRNAAKRGGGVVPLRVTSEQVGVDLGSDDLVALDEALDRLGELEPRLRQVVECRFFGGLTEEETAAALGVTSRTVQRDWAKARAWLYKELYPAPA
jgi:RNA polymerase sigma factor (TIGR02999 family)